ncbi:MAG: hypothetical protein AAF721_35985 [Myxococcota bacterium]
MGAAALLVMAGACQRNPDTSGLTAGGEDGGETGTAETTSGGPVATDTGAADESSGTEGAAAPLYDVGGIPDSPPPPTNCDGGGSGGNGNGGPQFSFIWVANSGEATVSKIDTVTLEEVGRYRTHPVQGDPSRTSVSLNGDVAIANRNGGLVKFYANPAHCVDRNNDGQIQTSSGADDVLAWDDEECRAWFTEFDYQSQRPVAWTPGEWNQSQCRYINEKVWTSGTNGGWGGKFPGFPGDDGGVDPGEPVEPGGEGEPGKPGLPPPPGGGGGGKGAGVDVILVNGDSGEVEELVNVPEVQPDGFGLYGGAVDNAGNFFGTQLGYGHIVRVQLSDLEPTVWPQVNGGYGMTVDQEGRVWTCDYQAGRFDPQTEQWDVANTVGGGGSGCMVDAEGILWVGGTTLTGIDTDTMEVVATHNINGGKWDYLKGISVDFAGFVWAVTTSDRAYRIDPETGEYETVFGLVSPYTYSDMTGFALANVGGWTPAG